MAERFYLNLPLSLGLAELTGPEAHHLAQVRRLRPDDLVCLFNGDGNEYPGRVQAVHKKSVLIDIVEVRHPNRELPFRLEVAAPLPKGDRAQFLIEKLTELGATSFIPLECARSVIHPREGKMEKLERYVIEASKQCGRNVLMAIEPLCTLADLFSRHREGDVAWIAHVGGEEFATSMPATSAATRRIAVGPEGGFTDAEVECGRATNWRVVSLGARILRIETAAILLTALHGVG